MDTESAIVYSQAPAAHDAAAEICRKVRSQLSGPPDALVLFASPRYDQPALVREVNERSGTRILVGGSSAGEFTSEKQGSGLACVLALRSRELRFSAGIGRSVRSDRASAARQIAASFVGLSDATVPFRTALVMTDALAGHADDLIEQLTLVTAATYQFFGGGAGDDARFQRTNVFFGSEVVSDAAVALEILSRKPLGVGVGHGWIPDGPPLRVTEVSGNRLIGLNGLPAADAFSEHARRTGQTLDLADPIPFFLHNILGILEPSGVRLRVPLSVHGDGSVECAAEIPPQSVVHIMRTDERSAVAAAARATEAALAALRGHRPKVALFFDCVATRLRMGDAFGFELSTVSERLGGSAKLVGCNTHGQIARAHGQFGGFHNCTAVVCVLPE